jgi:hypothetical protein
VSTEVLILGKRNPGRCTGTVVLQGSPAARLECESRWFDSTEELELGSELELELESDDSKRTESVGLWAIVPG